MLKELINNRRPSIKPSAVETFIPSGDSVIEPDAQADVNPSALDTSAPFSAPQLTSSPQSAVEA